eukprot:6174555-Pleurochrysis_carterae.AAC.2
MGVESDWQETRTEWVLRGKGREGKGERSRNSKERTWVFGPAWCDRLNSKDSKIAHSMKNAYVV